MAVVIHTIKGGQYAYNHHREGKKVVSDYMYPVDGSGHQRPIKEHPHVTQQKETAKKPSVLNEDEQKLKDAGFTIMKVPNKIIESKFDSAKYNKNVSKDTIATKIVGESDKAYQVTGTRLPTGDLSDTQKVTILNTYRQKVPVWIPKSHVTIKE